MEKLQKIVTVEILKNVDLPIDRDVVVGEISKLLPTEMIDIFLDDIKFREFIQKVCVAELRQHGYNSKLIKYLYSEYNLLDKEIDIANQNLIFLHKDIRETIWSIQSICAFIFMKRKFYGNLWFENIIVKAGERNVF